MLATQQSAKLRIVPHDRAHSNAVEAFNGRMQAGGSSWGFYVEPKCDWIPPRPGSRVWREYYLAVEDDGTVRGGYALKPQPWRIQGQEYMVADWQGPFSEGAIDRRYAAMGLRMIRDMTKRRPLLYSWGHGGRHQPMVQMLEKMGWLLHETPFCVYVRKPFRFLRGNRYLRTTPERRWLLDAAAFSGAGSLAIRGLHKALAVKAAVGARALPPACAAVEVVPRFEAWADTLWERCKDDYAALAVRDADIMNTLLPQQGWPPAIRLRVHRGNETLGWAVVLDTQMDGDARFGSLRVGSVIDCLGPLADAPTIIRSATDFLCRRGVDIIVSNQAHPTWVSAFARSGFALLPGRRLFAAAPAFQTALNPFAHTQHGLHLTNMDGHGPHLL